MKNGGVVNSYTERHGSSQTVTVYSIASIPEPTNSIDKETTNSKISSVDRRISQPSLSTNQSKLINGGLCGLQNLGNTVKKFSTRLSIKCIHYLFI